MKQKTMMSSSDEQRRSTSERVCPFFMRGRCRLEKCQFKHEAGEGQASLVFKSSVMSIAPNKNDASSVLSGG